MNFFLCLLYAHFFVQKNVEVNMLLRAYPNIYYRTENAPGIIA